MRIAKFCSRNTEVTDSSRTVELLQAHHQEIVQVKIVDCFSRCLECRVKPFCRVQLTTIEASNAKDLVQKVLTFVQEDC